MESESKPDKEDKQMRRTIYTTQKRMERLLEEVNNNLSDSTVKVKIQAIDNGSFGNWVEARLCWWGDSIFGVKGEEAEAFMDKFNEALEFVNYINYNDFMVVPEGTEVDDSIFNEFFEDEFYEAKVDHYFEPSLNRLMDIYNKVNVEEVELGGKTIRRIWSYDDEMEDAS